MTVISQLAKQSSCNIDIDYVDAAAMTVSVRAHLQNKVLLMLQRLSVQGMLVTMMSKVSMTVIGQLAVQKSCNTDIDCVDTAVLTVCITAYL